MILLVIVHPLCQREGVADIVLEGHGMIREALRKHVSEKLETPRRAYVSRFGRLRVQFLKGLPDRNPKNRF